MNARELRGLIQEQETLGMVPVFWKDEADATNSTEAQCILQLR